MSSSISFREHSILHGRGVRRGNLQFERARVVRYFEMARLARPREHYRSHLVPLVARAAGRYETLMGVHAAGFGIWSARLFARTSIIVAGTIRIPAFFTVSIV